MASRSQLSAQKKIERKARVSAIFKKRREKAHAKEVYDNEGGPMKTAPQKKKGDNATSLANKNSAIGTIHNRNKRMKKLADKK